MAAIPPFRADHVGSLLRPAELREARARALPATQLQEIEDRCIRAAVAKQDSVPLENLCPSPQCGFASTRHGNVLSEDEQWRKLERVVEVARQVRGE
jgi:methionine synthase II (cobalamin-independent)